MENPIKNISRKKRCHCTQMFCPAKFAPMPSTLFNRPRSSEIRPVQKPAISNAGTHNTLKTPKTAQCVPNKPRTHSALFGQNKTTYKSLSGYESPSMKHTNCAHSDLVDLSELFTPIHALTPMPHQNPICLNQEDIEWLGQVHWIAPNSCANSYELVVDPDWKENPATLPDW